MSSLYDTDFALWSKDQARLVREAGRAATSRSTGTMSPRIENLSFTEDDVLRAWPPQEAS